MCTPRSKFVHAPNAFKVHNGLVLRSSWLFQRVVKTTWVQGWFLWRGIRRSADRDSCNHYCLTRNIRSLCKSTVGVASPPWLSLYRGCHQVWIYFVVLGSISRSATKCKFFLLGQNVNLLLIVLYFIVVHSSAVWKMKIKNIIIG